MNFKGKAILLFAPSFFGYEKSIQKYLYNALLSYYLR